MKIGPSDSSSLVTPSTAPATKAPPGATAPLSADAQATRSTGVSVTVSTQLRCLEQAKRNDTTDVDAQKVASVKAAIEDGSFTVNAEAIADKLLANAQETLSRTKN